jgi:hypothetical protein
MVGRSAASAAVADIGMTPNRAAGMASTVWARRLLNGVNMAGSKMNV